jgi:hypothetical protein
MGESVFFHLLARDAPVSVKVEHGSAALLYRVIQRELQTLASLDLTKYYALLGKLTLPARRRGDTAQWLNRY